MEECAVCGGRVHEYDRVSASSEGTTVLFCSDEHRTQFESRPETYR